MCRGGIYNSANQAVLGVPFLGGLCLTCLQLPQRAKLQTLVGRRGGAGPLPTMCGCLVQTLHHAASSGLGRGFAVIPLWHDLWTPSLAQDVPRSLGDEGGAARAGSGQAAELIWLPGNLKRSSLSILVCHRGEDSRPQPLLKPVF